MINEKIIELIKELLEIEFIEFDSQFDIKNKNNELLSFLFLFIRE